MRIMKTVGRRKRNGLDRMYSVNGVVKMQSLEDAADLAFEVLCEEMRTKHEHTLWTAYPQPETGPVIYTSAQNTQAGNPWDRYHSALNDWRPVKSVTSN